MVMYIDLRIHMKRWQELLVTLGCDLLLRSTDINQFKFEAL